MIYIILPAHNEVNGISQQITSLHNFLLKRKYEHFFIIVDDGSTDGTDKKIKSLSGPPFHLIEHTCNQGPGIAFNSGFQYIYRHILDNDIVITLDSDNTHDLNTVDMMILKIKEGYDVVLGSVFVKGGGLIGVPPLKLMMTYASSFIYRIFFPIKGVKDYSGFFRAIRGSTLKKIYSNRNHQIIQTSGFGCMAEMLLKYRKMSLLITEVPMIVRYDLKTSSSKMKIFKTIKEHLNIISKNICILSINNDY